MKRPVAVVTGGAGFIGSHMVDLLVAEGFEVRVIDNLVGGREANLRHLPEVRLEVRDLRQVAPDDPVYHQARYLFHFAGIGDIVPSIDKPQEYMSVNVQATVAALEGARQAGVERFVYAASSSCYGLARQVPTPETSPIDCRYPYALSKYMGEMAALHWYQVYRMPVVCLRIFNAYGPRSRTTGAYGAVFGVFLKQKLSGRPFTLVGDGTQTRDFVYATDVARAFLRAATHGQPGEVYNLGAGAPQSVLRLIELLGGGAIEHLPVRPGEPDCTWADITRLRALGWEPQVSFEQGVASMVERIEAWQDAPLWDPTSIQRATAGWFEVLGERR